MEANVCNTAVLKVEILATNLKMVWRTEWTLWNINWSKKRERVNLNEPNPVEHFEALTWKTDKQTQTWEFLFYSLRLVKNL